MTAEIWGTWRDQWSLRLLAKVSVPTLTRTLGGILPATQISAGNLNKAANASLSSSCSKNYLQYMRLYRSLCLPVHLCLLHSLCVLCAHIPRPTNIKTLTLSDTTAPCPVSYALITAYSGVILFK